MLRKMWKPRYFDIGVNFLDGMFHGMYHGSVAKHPADIDHVVARARLFNVDKMLITASLVAESESHLALVARLGPGFASTVGVHPCTVAQEFYGGLESTEVLPTTEAKLATLADLAVLGQARGLVRAFGEIGLDYDRLHYSSVDQQKTMFKRQLDVYAALPCRLPLFLHMRAACDDFVLILEPYLASGAIAPGAGVVHSFTGTEDELQRLLALGFYIGVNGCSLKSSDNLAVARQIPLDRLLIETDAPWCEIRKSHASYDLVTPYPNFFYPKLPGYEPAPAPAAPKGKKQPGPPKLDDNLPFPVVKKENYEKHTAAAQQLLEANGGSTEYGPYAYPLVKSRNEPVFVGHVAQIMTALHGIEEEDALRNFVDTIYTNSCKLFHMQDV